MIVRERHRERVAPPPPQRDERRQPDHEVEEDQLVGVPRFARSPSASAPTASASTSIVASTIQSRVERRPPDSSSRPPGSICQRVDMAASVRPTVGARPPTEVDPGIDVRPIRRAAPIPMLDAMIEANGLTKRLGGRTVVSDVSFRCEPGTVTGFLGPNGAGKTTTMRMIVGLSAPDAGSSTVLGQRLPRPGEPGPPRRRPARRQRPAPRPPRPRGARGQRADDGRRPQARRRAADARRAGQVRRPQARAPVLARHAPAARARARAARRSRGADPRRARQRPRPRGDPLDAAAAARLRRPRRDRLPVLAPALRGRGDRRPARDHRRRPDRRRRLARGSARRRRHARPRHRRRRARRRAAAADLDAKHVEDGAFIVDANTEAVGRAALDGGVVLVHLAPSEGAGLEQLFFELTESPA